MSKETEAKLKRIGQLLAIALGVIALTAAMRTGVESWLVPRRAFEVYVYQRDSALAVWLTRDSVTKRDINEQLRLLRLYQTSRAR